MSESIDGKRVSLKRRGFLLCAFGSLVVGSLISAASDNARFLDRDNWQLAGLCLLYFTATNAAAYGAILLYTAARHSPPRTGSGRTSPMALRMAGANLLFVALAFVTLEDSGSLGADLESSWTGLTVLFVVCVFFGVGGNRLLRRGAKHEARGATETLRQDSRPPVLYLRSFKDDDQVLLGSRLARLSTAPFSWMAMVSAEQEIARSLRPVGPVVAIGRPGERLPQLGAARLYVDDDQWQATVIELMQKAKLVVIRGGGTGGLQWEIDQAVKLMPPDRLILISLGSRRERERFERAMEGRFGPIEGSPARAALGRILYFDTSDRLHGESIRMRADWASLLMPFRPYRASLDFTIQRVLQTLEQMRLA